MAMGRTILFLCVLAVFPCAHLSYAQEGNEAQPQKCSKLLIRKEWRTLTHSEKTEWVGAVKCLASIRHERLSLTKDQTVLEGKRSLYLFDTSLRDTCGYNGPTPYWDWSRDHADLFASPVFGDSAEYGLGGTGDCDSSPEADCTVTTGAFAPSTGNFELAWPIPHALRRNLTLITGWFDHELPQNRTLGPEFVRNSTEQTTGDFFRFQYAMTLMHNHVHNFVGGDLAGDCPAGLREEDCKGMAISFTPNDPLFWLHHVQLDRLWSEWQRHHPFNFAAFSGMPLNPQNMTDPRYDLNAHADHHMSFDVQSVPVAPRSVFDTESWPLCYRYTDES
ncbi:hypothetical protein N0V83_006185 [Neocucurbitaria cava]|uniref:Tyrosinase copper-binding domain-containing protein n=1 Tax=Neocucurbitaria cava TaxID=798079 RepID=A0A9W8Y7G3_9PLEO|nr:hypothetical protein N0V83_006185 [Neocucurbitaria cava]